MKLTAYKDLESSKRAQTLSRIILIGGAHLVIIGGAYFVTHFGGNEGNSKESLAGVGTWSSNSANASAPSVDASASTLFDDRAGNLAGYNAGNSKPILVASNSSAASSSGGRFAPRRPSDTGSAGSGSSTLDTTRDDDILQPLNRSSSELYPVRSSSQPSANLSDTIEYTVQSGDSIWAISKRFGVTERDISAANPGLKANAIHVGQVVNIPRSSDSQFSGSSSAAPTPSPVESKPVDGSIYTVKSGDVLSRIASRQGVTVAQIKAANGLKNDVIRIGQELVIPTKTNSAALVSQQHRGTKVTIEAGDTLDKYAAIYGVSVAELMKLNNIENPRLIRIGQTLLIPEKGSARSSSVSAQTQTQTRTQSQTPTRREPTRQPATQTEPLGSLDDLLPDSDQSELPGLDDAFGSEDLEDQPLIQISDN